MAGLPGHDDLAGPPPARQFGRDLPDCDRAALTDPGMVSPLLAAATEATRQGAGQLATEMRILFTNP